MEHCLWLDVGDTEMGETQFLPLGMIHKVVGWELSTGPQEPPTPDCEAEDGTSAPEGRWHQRFDAERVTEK